MTLLPANGMANTTSGEKAQRELAALRKRSAYSATVIRDGKQMVVSTDELVPGDLIELEAGDHVPADARLIESFAFGVPESALTAAAGAERCPLTAKHVSKRHIRLAKLAAAACTPRHLFGN